MQRPLALAGLVLAAYLGAFLGVLEPFLVLSALVVLFFVLRFRPRAEEASGLEIEALREDLAETKAALAKSSRAAGTAEIATGVLHNVGNVLNSVNVSATLAASRLKNSSAIELKRMLEIVDASGEDLADFLAKDERGAHFYTVLRSLSERIDTDQDSLSRELEAMNTGLDHIKELLRSQQSFATRRGSLERMRLETVIDQAVAISNQALTPRGIQVIRKTEELPEFDMDGHRIMEVLVNLLQNAKQAIFGAQGKDGRIVIVLERTENDMARITVTDSGPGISPENMERVFHHGFTTRSDGHGFGLHTSADAAREMGGSLTVENSPASEGGGARFTLDLPISVEAPLPGKTPGGSPREASQANALDRTAQEQEV